MSAHAAIFRPRKRTKLPSPSHLSIVITTQNLRSAHAGGPRSRQAQQAKCHSAMQHLTDQNHIVCFQELGLASSDPARELLNIVDGPAGSQAIVCSSRRGAGSGVGIFLHKLIAKYYTASQPPLKKVAGRAVMALLAPIQQGPTILIINLHLGSTWEKRTAQLGIIRKAAPTADYYFVLGDWNMVEAPSDGPPGYSGLRWSAAFRTEYNRFVAHFRLTERPQLGMTHFALLTPKNKPLQLIATRIDRILTSHTAGELGVTRWTVYLSNLGWSMMRALRMADVDALHALVARTATSATASPVDQAASRNLEQRILTARKSVISDHEPVTLNISVKSGEKLRPQPRLHGSDTNNPAFKAMFQKIWDPVKVSPDFLALSPPLQMELFNEYLYKAHKLSCKRKKDAGKEEITYVHRANVAAALIRLFHARSLDANAIQRLLRLHKSWLPKYPTDYLQKPIRSYKISSRLMTRMLKHLTKTAYASAKEETYGTSAPLGPRGPPDVLKSIKQVLASERGGITRLLDPEDMDGPPTDDPVRMAAIALAYYQRTWKPPARVATAAELERYIGPPVYQPSPLSLPTEEDLCDVLINHSPGKCAGPNGITFDAYKATAAEATPVLYGLLNFLAAGHAPPPDFNSALLFILPKDSSLKIDHTRPISVNNTDNRIIARVTALAVSSLLQERLHPCQRGCVAGRTSMDDLRQMADQYHKATQRGTQSYLLLLDFAKAYDSVQHEFIIAAARHKGMPEWFVLILQGLFHGANVTPVMGNQRGSQAIGIFRGVKQGCALSVIAFLLTIDILLWRILPDPNVDLERHMLAYVDDISFQVYNREFLAGFMEATNAFNRVSAMNVNITKTELLTAKPMTWADRTWIAGCAWPNISTPLRGKLLGLWIGRDVNASVIFKSAFAKYYARLRAYKPSLKLIPPHLRPLVFNMFILPVLTYLCQFYLPWYGSTDTESATIRSARYEAHRTLTPFNGSAYSYTASLETERFGPAIPMKDLWAVAYAMQAALCTPDEIREGAGDEALLPPHTAPPPVLTSDAHRLEAMGEVRYRATLVAGDPLYDPDPLLEAHAKGPVVYRRYLYKLLVQAYMLDTGEPGANRHNALGRVMQARQLPVAGIKHLDKNTKALRPLIPLKYMHSHFLNLHNTLVTKSRLFPITGDPVPECPICRKPGTRDQLTHIVLECKLVRTARHSLLRWAGCENIPQGCTEKENAAHYRQHSLLATTYPSKPTLTAALHLLVNHASWALSRRCFPMYWSENWQVNAARITDFVATQLLNCAKKGKWTLTPTQDFGLHEKPMALRVPRGTNSEERKRLADITCRAVVDRLRNSGKAFLMVGTDGSARPNPGPAGAGVVIQTYNARGRLTTTTTIHEGLGEGTNNEGEFYAFGMATQYILARHNDLPSNTPIYFQSDSQLAVGVVSHLSRPSAPATKTVAHAVRALYRRFCQRFPMAWTIWCPAHRGNPINEAADKAANAGTKLSEAGQGLSPEAKVRKIMNGDFLPTGRRISTQRHITT